MSRELPIACSLGASELAHRLKTMADLGRDALLDGRTDGTRATLRFTAGLGVRDRLDAIVAAESHCCAFLTMRLVDEPDAVVLLIDAPEGADLALAALVDAFAGARA